MAAIHQIDQDHDSILVLACSIVALVEELSELLEVFGV